MNLDGLKGGLGGECIGVRDVRMIERLMRSGNWEMTNPERREVIEEMLKVVRKSKGVRAKVTAARVLVSADAINVRRESDNEPQEVYHHHDGAVGVSVSREELLCERDYLQYLRHRAAVADGDARAVCENGGLTLEVCATPAVPGLGSNGHADGNGRYPPLDGDDASPPREE